MIQSKRLFSRNLFSGALFILLGFFCLKGFSQVDPQEKARPTFDVNSKIKGTYIYTFTRYFQWPKLTDSTIFRIGLLGRNENLEGVLRMLSENKKIGNNYFEVVVFEDMSQLKSTEILYVDIRKYPNFNLNENFKNTLIITENDSLLKNTMLSFIIEDRKIKFALNKINIHKSNLTMNHDLQPLSALVIEDVDNNALRAKNENIEKVKKWNEILNKMESSKVQDDKSVTFTKEELEQVLGKYNEQSNEISSRDENIRKQEKQIEDQKQSIESQKRKLDNQLLEIQYQKKNILIQEKKINSQINEINEQEKKLQTVNSNLALTTRENEVQKEALETRKRELIAQQGKISNQKEVLEKQEENIRQQKEKLYIQLEQISTQQTILWMSFGFVIIIICFLILVFRNYKKIQSVNALLEIQKTEITEQNSAITRQKQLIEEKHKEITDSINYAERIQRALLASNVLLDDNLKEYFVLFKPKDVVSGDFYWASLLANGNFVLVTADSTGHGVPGAIMSILNMASLKEAVIQKIHQPHLILNETRKLIIESLKNDGSSEGGKDGMDASAICFDFKNNRMYCACAFNPVWIIRNNQIIEIESDRMPVGKHALDNRPFTLHTFDLEKGDLVYSLTDGYPDQFGGPTGKKFKYKKLQELLLTVVNESMETQKQKLNDVFENWRGNLEQVDDVCLIGVRV